MIILDIKRSCLALIAFLLVFAGCREHAQAEWGCKAPCDPGAWLRFPCDSALLFTDSSGAIKQTLEIGLLAAYAATHPSKKIKADHVKLFDEALSCKLWTCEKTKTGPAAFDPQNLVVFFKESEVLAYVATCSQSHSVACFPDSENKEIGVLSGILYTIQQQNESDAKSKN